VNSESVRAFFEQHGSVESLEFTEEFEDHLAERATYTKHMVALYEVVEVHQRAPRYFSNGTGLRAPILMIGPTGANRMLTVPIEPSSQKGIWLPVTAFECNRHHIERYQEAL